MKKQSASVGFVLIVARTMFMKLVKDETIPAKISIIFIDLNDSILILPNKNTLFVSASGTASKIACFCEQSTQKFVYMQETETNTGTYRYRLFLFA